MTTKANLLAGKYTLSYLDGTTKRFVADASGKEILVCAPATSGAPLGGSLAMSPTSSESH